MVFKKMLTVVFAGLLASVCYGQKFCSLSVYFNTDSYQLSRKEKTKIDSLLKTIDAHVQFDVRLTGHTDIVGTHEYNQKLSENRVQAVEHYLLQNINENVYTGIGQSFDKLNYKGKEADQFGKNRRVEIELWYSLPKIQQLGEYKLKAEEFVVNANRADSIVAQSGTKIFIAPNSFVFKDGTPVNGNVTISYLEYRDPIDFILGGIPMTHEENGQPFVFNSSGMFKMEGSQNGKEIAIAENQKLKIEFVPTQLVANTNFYDFDTTQKKWSTQQTITGVQNTHPLSPTLKLELCTLNPCEAATYIAKTGNQCIDEKTNLVSSFIHHRTTYPIQQVNHLLNRSYYHASQMEKHTKYIDSLKVYLKKLNNGFKLETISREDGKIKFKVKCDSCPINPYQEIDQVIWEYQIKLFDRSKKFMDTDLFSCYMYSGSKPGQIRLRVKEADNSKIKTFTLDQVITQHDISKLDKKEFKDKIKLFSRLNTARRLEINRVNNLINTSHYTRGKIQFKIDSCNLALQPIESILQTDTLHCFWKKNGPYLTSLEKRLPAITWLDFFDKNHDIMKERYHTKLNSDNIKSICDAYNKIDSSIRIQDERRALNQYASTSMESMKFSLGIGNFGIYNCDQLARLKDPVEISAGYIGPHNDTLSVFSAFLIDKNINSVLTFNGYMDLWPTHFSYAKNSENMLIVFDEKGQPYMCKPNAFKKAVKSDEKVKYFLVEPIHASSSKEAILANR